MKERSVPMSPQRIAHVAIVFVLFFAVSAPSLAQNGQAAEAPGIGQLKTLRGNKAVATQGLGDELAGLGWQSRDIANGAGTGALDGAERLADQVGDIGGMAMLAFSRLDKHTGYRILK